MLKLDEVGGSDLPPDHSQLPPELGALGWSGHSYAQGLLRFHDRAASELAAGLVADAFGIERHEVAWFAIDWLGRQFGSVTPEGFDGVGHQVVVADVGANQMARFEAWGDFVNEVASGAIVEKLNNNGLTVFLSANSLTQIPYDHCAGFIHPPFLGGEFSTDNLELSDIDVYWTLLGQLTSTSGQEA